MLAKALLLTTAFDSRPFGGYVRRDVRARGLAAPVHTAMEDGELVGRIANGDQIALGLLYDRFVAVLLAVGRRILNDAREAEDLAHDVFLEIWRSAADYDPARGTVQAWILMRMRSRALDRRKAPRVSRRVSLDPATLEAADLPAGPEDPHLAPDRTRVRRALSALPDEQRTVLELGYYHGLSSTEIANREAIPVGTVKSRIAAGLAKLRAGLDIPPRGSS